MTLQQFSKIFALLAVQLRATDADEATIRGYHKALEDIEPEFVAMAAQRMARDGGASEGDNRHWFPKTSEWREMAAKIERERVIAQQAMLRRLKDPLCVVCEDTGWERTDGANWVKRCHCAALRRLEVLGRRPWPELPEATSQPGQLERVEGLLAPKGMR